MYVLPKRGVQRMQQFLGEEHPIPDGVTWETHVYPESRSLDGEILRKRQEHAGYAVGERPEPIFLEVGDWIVYNQDDAGEHTVVAAILSDQEVRQQYVAVGVEREELKEVVRELLVEEAQQQAEGLRAASDARIRSGETAFYPDRAIVRRATGETVEGVARLKVPIPNEITVPGFTYIEEFSDMTPEMWKKLEAMRPAEHVERGPLQSTHFLVDYMSNQIREEAFGAGKEFNQDAYLSDSMVPHTMFRLAVSKLLDRDRKLQYYESRERMDTLTQPGVR